MKLFFATGNSGKIVSARRELRGLGIEVEQARLELDEPRSHDLMEIGSSKALSAFRSLGKPVMVNDSGFYLHRWEGFPGAYTNHAIRSLGIQGMLKLVQGEERGCEFRNVVAYMDGMLREPVLFESNVTGSLAESARGGQKERQWSVLHNIFIPEGFTSTLGEMTEGEYRDYWEWRTREFPIFRELGEWLARERILGRTND